MGTTPRRHGGIIVKKLIGLICAISLTGCTVIVGTNNGDHVSPRLSWRSVDTSGAESEGLQDMEGGADVETKASLQ